MNIHFQKASLLHEELIFKWLAEPHMMEFWDNSQEHKDDILNFIHGKKQHYFYGTTVYWIGLIDDTPYCFILSDILQPDQKLSKVAQENLSETGHTISLDFGIGNKQYLRQGLAASTLIEFVEYYRNSIDLRADTFFIDPDANNPRAKHVYEKAGFIEVGFYVPDQGAFIGQPSHLMIKKYDKY